MNLEKSMIDPSNKLDRLLMFLPGFLSWLVLLLPLWLGYLSPKTTSFFLTFFAVYWVYMACARCYGLIKGYLQYLRDIKIDWYKKCLKLDFKNLPNPKTLPESFEKVKHFILIPTVSEDYVVLEPTIRAIVKSNFPNKQIVIVIGTEELGKDKVKKVLEQIKAKYKDDIPRIMQFIHPKGLKGEIAGVASPNRRWAAEHAVKQLIEEGENIRNYIFTTYDSDWVVHKNYFARLTYQYLTTPKRFNRFFQSNMHIFKNNIWDVPIASRIESNTVTLGLMSADPLPMMKETFSAYSVALDTVVAANYWDVSLIDDTVFYWRAFNARKGDFKGKSFYMPMYGDATGGDNFVRAHLNLYKQLVRWGWGSVGTVIALKSIFDRKNTAGHWQDKWIWLFWKLERHLIMRTSAFIITFGFALLTFINEQFRETPLTYGLPEIISIFLSFAMVMFIPYAYIRRKIYGSFPRRFSTLRKVMHFCEGPFIIVNLLTFSFIPFIYAETQMMFGKLPKTTFYTPKTRRKR